MRVKLSKLQPGNILNNDVYNCYGSLLLSMGHCLTVADIENLQRSMILSVDIRQLHTDRNDENQILAFYNQAISSMKEIFDHVRANRKIPVEEILDIMTPLAKYVYEKPSITSHLVRIQTLDYYTYEHSVNVGMLSAALGKWLNLPLNQVIELSMAGFLHDFGKTQVPLDILNKPGRLTDEEMKLMQKHTEFGYELIKKVPDFSEESALTALYHHERMDGSGYPFGLEEPEIPFFSRIVMIADIYDAMTSKRVYRKDRSPFRAVETIFKERFGLLDPKISTIFLENIIQNYIGMQVKLSNGLQGEVVFITPTHPGRPTIRTKDEFIVLSEHPDLSIQELIKA